MKKLGHPVSWVSLFWIELRTHYCFCAILALSGDRGDYSRRAIQMLRSLILIHLLDIWESESEWMTLDFWTEWYRFVSGGAGVSCREQELLHLSYDAPLHPFMADAPGFHSKGSSAWRQILFRPKATTSPELRWRKADARLAGWLAGCLPACPPACLRTQWPSIGAVATLCPGEG